MAWSVEYSETALKRLRKCDKQIARRILEFMDERVAGDADPRAIGKALTGPAKGAFWRYRVGDMRVICEIQDAELRVLVIEIGDQRDVYR